MEAAPAGFAPGMRGAPAARRIGLNLRAAAAAGGAGAMSAASSRVGHLAFATARLSIYAGFNVCEEVRPPRREFAVMAAAAARGVGTAAVVDPGAYYRRCMVAVAAGGSPSAAAMRGLRRWSVAAGSTGTRFFCGSGNFHAAERGGGTHRVVSMSEAKANIRCGYLIAPSISYAASQGPARGTCLASIAGPHVWRGRRFFGTPGGLLSSKASMALHTQHRPSRLHALQDASSGDMLNSLDEEEALSDDKLKSEKKGGQTLDEFMDSHPRTMAVLKLAAIALCTFVCYLSAKGDPRLKLLVESAKDGAEVYAFLATVLIIFKKLIFPGSGKKRYRL